MVMLFWGVGALVAGFVVLWVTARGVAPNLAPDPQLPTTPLERAARWSLGAGVVLVVAAAGMLVSFGPQVVFEGDGPRVVFQLLLLVTLMALGGGTLSLKRKARGDASLVDELDEAILQRAPAMQSLATVITLTVWTVGLVERFYAAGAVPVMYVILVFWSCLVVNLMGLPVGILVGYRRQ